MEAFKPNVANLQNVISNHADRLTQRPQTDSDMKEFFEGITGKITIGSIAAFVFGCCIITYSLSSFHIVDFDPLKPHAIIVGLVFFIFLGTNIIFFSYRAGSVKDHTFSMFKLIVQALIKIPAFALLVFFVCEPTMMWNSNYKLYFFSLSADIKAFSILTIPMGLALIANTLSSTEAINQSKINKRFRNSSIFLCILSVFLLFLTFCRNDEFRAILYLEGFICASVYVFIVGYRSAKLHDERLAKTGLENKKWSDDSLFVFGHSELGLQLKKLFEILALIFVALKITLDYTSAVYLNLPQSYGGGKLEEMSYVVKSDTITGSKVYETNEYVFLSNKDSTIIKLDWKDINTILKSRTK